MPQAQVTPQYVNPAKPGKKFGNIKEASGVKWIIPAGWEGMFAPNVPAHIDYEPQTWGSEAVNIVRGVNGNMQPAAPAMPAGPGWAPPPSAAPPQGVTQPLPNIMPPNADRPNGDHVAEEIFVTGIVGRSMGSGQFSVHDIALLAKAATQAWRERNMQAPPASGYNERNPPPADPNDPIGI